MTSEPWEDLGYAIEKGSAVKYIEPPTIRRYEHESEEITSLRRARNLEAIFRVMPEAKIEASGCVMAEVKGKRFEFWPASDSWFSESTRRYGTGIEKLCAQITRHLLNARQTSEGSSA